MFALEELQKMNKNELIKIIGNYINDQEIWLNKVAGLEKEINEQKAEVERLTEELEKTKDNRDGWRNRAWNDEKVISQLTEKLDKANAKLIEEYGKNTELQQQLDELKEQRKNIQQILYELGKCENDEERYIVWVKLIECYGIEVG